MSLKDISTALDTPASGNPTDPADVVADACAHGALSAEGIAGAKAALAELEKAGVGDVSAGATSQRRQRLPRRSRP